MASDAANEWADRAIPGATAAERAMGLTAFDAGASDSRQRGDVLWKLLTSIYDRALVSEMTGEDPGDFLKVLIEQREELMAKVGERVEKL